MAFGNGEGLCFNPRPRMEGDPGPRWYHRLPGMGFNPRPRMEGDP